MTHQRTFLLLVTAMVFAALTWPVIFSGIVGPGGPANDEVSYHIPVVRQFLQQWPTPNLGEYPSALAPGYYVVSTVVAKIFGGGVHALRILSGLFALGAVLLAQAFIPEKITSPSSTIVPFVLTLPLLLLPITLRSGMWFLADFPAFFFIVAALGFGIMREVSRPNVMAAILCLAVAVFFRQLSAWAAIPLCVSFWGQRHKGTWLTAAALLSLAAPLVVMTPLFAMWSGLVPPSFQHRHDGVNPAALTMTLAYVGIIAPFFFLANPRAVLGLLRSLRHPGISCAAGAITALLWPTDFNGADTVGRWGGPVWSLVQRLPVLQHRSVLFLPLCVAGALSLHLFAVACARNDRRRGQALALVTALLALGVVHCFTIRAFERYYQPGVLLLVAWLSSISIFERRENDTTPRLWGIVTLAGLFLVLSMVTEYYTLFRVHPLD